MTGLPAAEGSRVVLIGVPVYSDEVLTDVPGAAGNVARLRRLFTDPEVWGLPEEHVVGVDERAGIGEVLGRIHEAANEATDALVVYFAGHGLADRDDLRLMLAESAPSRRWTGLAYRDIRNLLLDHGSRARWKIVILDCCFAGAAFDGTLSGPDQVRDLTAIRGSFVLTACGENEFAWAPPGEEHTAFSGELIRLLDEGVEGGPEFLDLDTIYDRAAAGMREINGPVPQRRTHDAGGKAVLGRNRAWRPPQAQPPPVSRPVEPAALPSGLRREGPSVYVDVKPGGCHGVVDETAFYETERGMVGIDLNSGHIAWMRERRGAEAAVVGARIQFVTEESTTVFSARTGADVFTWSGEHDGGVAVYDSPEVTVLAEMSAAEGVLRQIHGLSSRDGSPLWTCDEDLRSWRGFFDHAGTTYLVAEDAEGNMSTLDIATGDLHRLDLPPGADAAAAWGLVWALAPNDNGGSGLSWWTAADGTTPRVADLRVEDLTGELRFRELGPEFDDFTPLVSFRPYVVLVDDGGRAAALWSHRLGFQSMPLGSADDVVEVYDRRFAVLTADERGRPVTRVQHEWGRTGFTVERHFRRVDRGTAISAPKAWTSDGRAAPARIALLDVRTGGVTELGTVQTPGMCAWSDTHLVTPTAEGLQVWRFRE
ncbi:caspase family protein [Phytomonospora sp. NPDC050363]|uniref:caspase family protein n=1 Tax=Phytomonospora sp. NPDC050363 TaxID=3155642 RepID=UPI00340182C4